MQQTVNLRQFQPKLRISRILMLWMLPSNQDQRMVNMSQENQYGLQPTTSGSHQDTTTKKDGITLLTQQKKLVGLKQTRHYGIHAVVTINALLKNPQVPSAA
jgi:hypothetical protein